MTSDAKQLRKEVEEFALLHKDKPMKFIVEHFANQGHSKSKIYYILRKKNDEKNASKESKKNLAEKKKTEKDPSEDKRRKPFPPEMQEKLKNYFAREYDVSINGATKELNCSRSTIKFWMKKLNIKFEGYKSSGLHQCEGENCDFCKYGLQIMTIE